MKTHFPIFGLLLLSVSSFLSPFTPPAANAMIEGSTGNDPVENHFWPTGSEGVANLKSRVARWSGPIGSGDTFDFRAKSSADLNEALQAFAKIAAPKRELILRNGPVESVWLKVGPGADENPDGARIDFSFVVWIPQVWHQLNNDPRNFFMAERPNFRRPVDPPRIIAYFGGGGKLAWEEITVPEGVTVIDQRGKPGDGPTFTGAVYEMNTGQTIAGARVTVVSGKMRVQPGSEAVPETTTDANGRFVLRGFPEGRYVVAVTATGYAGRTSGEYETFVGSDTREVTLHLAKAAKVTGVVRDAAGAPLSGVKVSARPVIAKDGFGYPGSVERSVLTDAEGHFTIEDLPVGYASLSAYSKGLTTIADPTTLYDVPNEEPIAFTLTGTGTVKGTLKVVEGRQANVSIGEAGRFNEVGTWGGGMNCQPDGSFEFKNVPPGEYLIGPSRGSDPKTGDPNVKTITVKAGETVTVEIVEEE